MIERLNHADIINQLNQGRKDLERYPESGAEYSYENAFHSVIMKKINEIIDKINELESRPPIIISYPNYYPHLPYTTPCDLPYMVYIP